MPPLNQSSLPESVRSRSPRLAWLLLALIASAYLLPGIVGHGPWKQDEAYSFGMIHHMLQTREYLVPTNAGQPFMEKPPLYYWFAAGFASMLHPWLNYVDGARIASAFFMLISLFFVALTAKSAWRENSFLSPRVLGTLALFAGSAGMIKHAHDMFTDVALVCGGVMALYGLLQIAQNQQTRTPKLSAALWFGLGVGIAHMSKGLFIPLLYATTACLAGVVMRECRSASYWRMVGLAVLVSLPFLVIWPVLLAQHSFPLFVTWFWDNNIGRFIGFSVNKLGADNDSAVVMRALFGFALPVAPLALLALLSGDWRNLHLPRVTIPLAFSVICIITLQISATARQLYLLPLIFPLCLLSVNAIARLPYWLNWAWDWFARLFFGLLTAMAWIVYAISRSPVEQHARLTALSKWLPLEYVTPRQPLALTAAVLISLAWLLALPRLKKSGQWRGAFSWFAGITMTWGVTFTLLLPWIDYAKSYEYVYARLTAKLAPHWRADDCMASVALGESEAPMLFYYAKILHRPLDDAMQTDCRWIIVQAPPYNPVHVKLPPQEWQPFWSDARDGDHWQMLTVYQRTTVAQVAR